MFERPGLTEGELDSELRSRATDYAKDHPGYVVKAGVLNAARMLHLTPRFERFAAADLNIETGAERVARFSFYALALLAIVGCFTAGARRAPWWIWIAPVLMFASGALLAGLIRYRLPADPFLILLAALALDAAWQRAQAAAAQRSGSPSMRATSPSTSRWRR